ncbi:hypothetical protein Q9R32_15940 [Actinotalea sp. AC32]|nr:hypothetical protein [Actinotalea sp. AC32]
MSGAGAMDADDDGVGSGPPDDEGTGETPAVPRRRGPRRATGGTPATTTPADGARDPFGVSRDDTDEGWGGRGGDDDERILREVPPHW